MSPTTLKIIGECIGALAIAEGFLIYYSQTRKRILIFKFISDALWLCNMLCLGNLTGALLNVLAMGRETVFYNKDKNRFFGSPLWVVFFMIVTAASPVYSLVSGKEGWFAVLPAIGSLVAVIAFAQSAPRLTRSLGLCSQLLWLTYAILSHNISSTVGNVVLVVSALAGMVRAAVRARRAEDAQGKTS